MGRPTWAPRFRCPPSRTSSKTSCRAPSIRIRRRRSSSAMLSWLPVQGTEGWQVDDPDPRHPRNWWRPGSLLVDELAQHGLQLLDADDPFVWSTDLDGAQFWERWPWFRSRKDK